MSNLPTQKPPKPRPTTGGSTVRNGSVPSQPKQGGGAPGTGK